MRVLSLVLLIGTGSFLFALDEQVIIEHVQQSITRSYRGLSRLVPEVLRIKGMSSSKVRHLLNNICSLPNTSYLEIGTWAGSTLVSALYRNQNTVTRALAIDNWSEYNGPKTLFWRNVARFLPQSIFTFYEIDAFSFDVDSIPSDSVNVYFYDGNHSQQSQKKAFTHFNKLFSDIFIAIVDDWNVPEVQIGTREAFDELGYTILFEQILPARFNGDLKNWWNGLYIAVIKK